MYFLFCFALLFWPLQLSVDKHLRIGLITIDEIQSFLSFFSSNHLLKIKTFATHKSFTEVSNHILLIWYKEILLDFFYCQRLPGSCSKFRKDMRFWQYWNCFVCIFIFVLDIITQKCVIAVDIEAKKTTLLTD